MKKSSSEDTLSKQRQTLEHILLGHMKTMIVHPQGLTVMSWRGYVELKPVHVKGEEGAVEFKSSRRYAKHEQPQSEEAFYQQIAMYCKKLKGKSRVLGVTEAEISYKD